MGKRENQTRIQSFNNRAKLRQAVKSTKPRKVERPVIVTPNRIFLSGGIGDIFAVESFIPEADRASLSVIFYGTSKRKPIFDLWSALPNYPSLKGHVPLWDDFSSFWCFFCLQECINKLEQAEKPHDNLRSVRDLSIIPFFERIKRGEIQYNNSSFLVHTIASVSVDLPSRFHVVCPYSSDNRILVRNYDLADWNATIARLARMDSIGVVLNSGNDLVPEHERIINLSNKTNVKEAVEILKKSSGYIGIDSCLSVLAAKLFSGDDLMVKSRNYHCYQHAQYYYAPKTEFSFMVTNISE